MYSSVIQADKDAQSSLRRRGASSDVLFVINGFIDHGYWVH